MRKSEKLINKIEKYNLTIQELSETVYTYVISNYHELEIESFVKEVNRIDLYKGEYVIDVVKSKHVDHAKLLCKLEKYSFRSKKLASIIFDHLFKTDRKKAIYFKLYINEKLGHIKPYDSILEALDDIKIIKNEVYDPTLVRLNIYGSPWVIR